MISLNIISFAFFYLRRSFFSIFLLTVGLYFALMMFPWTVEAFFPSHFSNRSSLEYLCWSGLGRPRAFDRRLLHVEHFLFRLLSIDTALSLPICLLIDWGLLRCVYDFVPTSRACWRFMIF